MHCIKNTTLSHVFTPRAHNHPKARPEPSCSSHFLVTPRRAPACDCAPPAHVRAPDHRASRRAPRTHRLHGLGFYSPPSPRTASRAPFDGDIFGARVAAHLISYPQCRAFSRTVRARVACTRASCARTVRMHRWRRRERRSGARARRGGWVRTSRGEGWARRPAQRRARRSVRALGREMSRVRGMSRAMVVDDLVRVRNPRAKGVD